MAEVAVLKCRDHCTFIHRDISISTFQPSYDMLPLLSTLVVAY